jgi:hypothetical protein
MVKHRQKTWSTIIKNNIENAGMDRGEARSPQKPPGCIELAVLLPTSRFYMWQCAFCFSVRTPLVATATPWDEQAWHVWQLGA